MDFEFTKEQEALRQEVRDFLEEEIRLGNFTPVPNAWSVVHSLEFTKKVVEKGWFGIDWPKDCGGKGRSHVDRFILYEEMLRYGAPTAFHVFADCQHSLPIIILGTEEQKREFIPRLIKGEICFSGQGTEPEGNIIDESIKTRAIAEGDYYIINGQKVWASHAAYANIFLVYVITDPDVPKGSRMKQLIVDSSLPGITVRPLDILGGHQPFAEVFYDDVKVHKKNVIKASSADIENLHLAAEWGELHRVMAFQPLWDAMIQFIKETKRDGKPLSQDPLVRSKVAQIEIELEVGKLLSYRVAVERDNGRSVSTVAPMVKAYGAELQQHQTNVIMEILGLYGQLMPASQLGPILETAASSYFYSKGDSLRGFVIEILWSIIAEKALGLPSYLDPPRRSV